MFSKNTFEFPQNGANKAFKPGKLSLSNRFMAYSDKGLSLSRRFSVDSDIFGHSSRQIVNKRKIYGFR